MITETPTMANGSWNSCQALLKAAKPAPAQVLQTRAPASLETMVVAVNDSWVAMMKKNIQPPIRPISPTSARRKSNRGCQRKPTLRMAGHIAAVCSTMPSVVPMASSWTSCGEMVSGVRFVPAVRISAMPTRLTTTLLTIGVHIGEAKLPRAFRIAPYRELTP